MGEMPWELKVFFCFFLVPIPSHLMLRPFRVLLAKPRSLSLLPVQQQQLFLSMAYPPSANMQAAGQSYQQAGPPSPCPRPSFSRDRN